MSEKSIFNEVLDTPKEFLQYDAFDASSGLLRLLICFHRDGQNFINRCTKPDRQEFLKISQAIGVGFVIMGTIGFIVKLGKCARCAGPQLPGTRRRRSQVTNDRSCSAHTCQQHIGWGGMNGALGIGYARRLE